MSVTDTTLITLITLTTVATHEVDCYHRGDHPYWRGDHDELGLLWLDWFDTKYWPFPCDAVLWREQLTLGVPLIAIYGCGDRTVAVRAGYYPPPVGLLKRVPLEEQPMVDPS